MALGLAPTNEMGVVFLFGTLAKELGFMVIRLQSGFPDCEAFREVEPGRWQWVRIEFEYESRKRNPGRSHHIFYGGVLAVHTQRPASQ
jgi:hypothetical protein